MVPPMVTLPVVADGPTRMAVAPSAALARVMLEPGSRSMELLLSTVTATPLFTAIDPPEAKRMSSRPEPVAFEVWIGVVRAFEITTWAWTWAAAIRGASAAAVASSLRIREVTPDGYAQAGAGAF